VLGAVSGAANPLWMTEWLCEALELDSGMRVLDLGCGRAVSSVFLHREFGVQVWATDLWFGASENLLRIRDAGADGAVFPLHADARSLPFAAEFFDAIVAIDSFPYYGTDDLYLDYLARLLKPGGWLGIAGAGLVREIEQSVPAHLGPWWTRDLWSLHSSAWWRRHWERSGILDIREADTLEEGWRLWLEWLEHVAPDNVTEREALVSDAGQYLGYVRVVGRRRSDIELAEPIVSVPTRYARRPLLRSDG
jgi:cyclopropane fatty-acyl-phospholipid synthase-like methyltransferase